MTATASSASASYPPSLQHGSLSSVKQDDSDSMFSSDMTFAQLGVTESTIQALQSCGIEKPTRVQAALIPLLLQGLSIQTRYAAQVKEAYELAGLGPTADSNRKTLGDFDGRPEPPQDDVNDVLMVGAETGSGKTLAYLLPYVEALRTSPIDLKAVILVPSRELCWQTSNFIKSYFEEMPRYLVLAGGAPPDVSDVKGVKMIIATPSALLKYFRFSQKADLSDKMIIIDEADMLLSGGFLADIECILDQPGMKPFATRRNRSVRDMNRNRLVFVGATYPHWTGEKVRSIVTWMKRRYPDIKAVQTENIHKHSDKLSSRWVFEPSEERRLELLLHVLKKEASSSDKIMVFASAADTVQRVARLVEDGYGKDELESKFGCALQLHRLVRSADRAESLNKFRNAEGRLLFCTDLGSRGLDLGNVTRVIEFEFASNVVAYLHRIGRTARAGASGYTDHYYDDIARPLAEAIKGRSEKDTTVVDGVFSRNRSFRRKLKQKQRKQMAEGQHGASETSLAQSMESVEIDDPDEEELKRFDG
ncbi:RNA helicase [Gracilaria domingensis]|nr:RNA helicase [Gracilaria domingensis]